jgi:hypothetical protein
VSAPYVRFWYAITVAFVAVLAVSIAGVAYTNFVQKQAERRAEAVRVESDRRWCSLLVDIGNSQRAVPPKTESGKRFAAEIDRLRHEFGCPDR